jgi:putative ABC transport system permease protein
MRVFDHLVQDLTWAVRSARRQPVFTLVLVLAPALGIALTTSIFSVFYGVLLRPLPFAEPSRLVLVKESLPKVVPFPINMPPAHAIELSRNEAFAETALFASRPRMLDGTPPERIQSLRASWHLLPLLGLTPAEGRNFTEQEDREGAAVAIVSDAFAKRHFGESSAVGRVLRLNAQPIQVIGVLPASLTFPTDGMQQRGNADVWVPLGLTPEERAPSNVDYTWSLLARLADGATVAQARQAAIPGIQRIVATLPPEIRGQAEMGAAIAPLGDELVGGSRRLLFLLLGAVGALLLITCLNVSNMLLSRSAARRREIAVRAAMGASPRRIVWQMLHENLLFFLLAGALGAVCAIWSHKAFMRLLPSNLPRTEEIGIDTTVLAFTLAVSLVTGLIVGLAPALGSLDSDLRGTLQEGSRAVGGGRLLGRVRRFLVVSQIAMTVVLLACAGLLVKSVFVVLDREAELHTERLLTFGVTLPDAQYSTPVSTTVFYRELRERLRQIPGAQSVGVGTDIPLEGRAARLISPDRPTTGTESVVLDYTAVEGAYFHTLGVPLTAGRFFDDHDRQDGELVAIVNEACAKAFWSGRAATDQRLKIGPPSSNAPWLRIVGVVANVSGREAGAVSPHIYVPLDQEPLPPFRRQATVVMRTAGPGANLETVVRNTVRALEPALPALNVRSMDQVVNGAVAPRSAQARLVALFGLTALLLSALGVYGVVAYSVSARTREIGIRMALGASRSTVWRSVAWEGVRLALFGVALGLPAAIAAGHLIRALLYGVSPQDAFTFSLVVAAVGLTALAASLVPSWRAVRVDPLIAVRNE